MNVRKASCTRNPVLAKSWTFLSLAGMATLFLTLPTIARSDEGLRGYHNLDVAVLPIRVAQGQPGEQLKDLLHFAFKGSPAMKYESELGNKVIYSWSTSHGDPTKIAVERAPEKFYGPGQRLSPGDWFVLIGSERFTTVGGTAMTLLVFRERTPEEVEKADRAARSVRERERALEEETRKRTEEAVAKEREKWEAEAPQREEESRKRIEDEAQRRAEAAAQAQRAKWEQEEKARTQQTIEAQAAAEREQERKLAAAENESRANALVTKARSMFDWKQAQLLLDGPPGTSTMLFNCGWIILHKSGEAGACAAVGEGRYDQPGARLIMCPRTSLRLKQRQRQPWEEGGSDGEQLKVPDENNAGQVGLSLMACFSDFAGYLENFRAPDGRYGSPAEIDERSAQLKRWSDEAAAVAADAGIAESVIRGARRSF